MRSNYAKKAEHTGVWEHGSDCEVLFYCIKHDSSTVLHILSTPWPPTVELWGGEKGVFLSSPSRRQTRISELPSPLLLNLFQFLSDQVRETIPLSRLLPKFPESNIVSLA